MEKQSILCPVKGSDKCDTGRMPPLPLTAAENRERIMCGERIKRLIEKNFSPEERIQ